jgi:hypothetical protein
MQLQLAVATATSAISPQVSAVVGSHLKTLIASDPSMRGPRGSSPSASDAKRRNGTAAAVNDRHLSEQEIDLLLDNALSCNPATVHVLERFLSQQQVERVRAFFNGLS